MDNKIEIQELQIIWIPVKKALPTDNRRVLLRIHNDFIEISQYENGKWKDIPKDNNVRFWAELP